MKKKIPKIELEDTLNNLEISEESKKTLSISLRYRNEPLIFSRLAQVNGVFMIVGYFISMSQHQELKNQESSIFIMLSQLFVGVFFLFYGTLRIRSIKLQKACVELIMKTQK